jgi:G3E family GTPase
VDELDRAPEAQEQVAFTDVVLLNKIDLVSGADLTATEKRIRQINLYTEIHWTEQCRIDLGECPAGTLSTSTAFLRSIPNF